MTRIAGNEEWAAKTGRSLAEVEEMVREAEEDDFPPGCLDPSTLVVHGVSSASLDIMHDTLIAAGRNPADYNL